MKTLMYANVFLNPNTVTQDITAWNTMKSTATLVVTPTKDGKTEVTVGGHNNGGALLDYWLKYDVLKEHNPNPLAQIKGRKATLVIFNDRLVVRAGGSAFKRWQKWTLLMSEIKSATLDGPPYKKTVVIENHNDEMLKVPYIDYELANNAIELIEYRMDLYQEEPEVLETTEKAASDTDNLAMDIPDQIGKLAELRDRGILSSEEFETKKAELLDRM